uniref:T-box domain-containing protein n=1 Tax=Pelusios castaneus TaxID=367368 RepID=A0A8C8S609_9SAUR
MKCGSPVGAGSSSDTSAEGAPPLRSQPPQWGFFPQPSFLLESCLLPTRGSPGQGPAAAFKALSPFSQPGPAAVRLGSPRSRLQGESLGPKKFPAGGAMLGEAEAGEPFSKADSRKAEPELPPTAAARYPLDGLSPERYYLPSPGPQGAELGGPCSLFPYPAAQHGPVYQAPGGARYPYGSVLSPGGFSAAVCSPGGRAQFGAAGGYQYGQGAAGSLYGPYPAAGSCGGLGALAVPGSGAGLRAQVFLCNRPLWLKFHRHQTEMIITKQGR